MRLNLTNPSPFTSVEIAGVAYEVGHMTLSDGLEFEKICGQKFLTDNWWGNLSGLTAFAWIVSRSRQPGVTYLTFRDTTELDSMIFVTEDDSEVDAEDPPAQAAQDAAQPGPTEPSPSDGIAGESPS